MLCLSPYLLISLSLLVDTVEVFWFMLLMLNPPLAAFVATPPGRGQVFDTSSSPEIKWGHLPCIEFKLLPQPAPGSQSAIPPLKRLKLITDCFPPAGATQDTAPASANNS